MTTADLVVRHVDCDRFTIDVRCHTLIVDQPVEDGGTDTAPAPTELFVASLAGCIAFYARRYLARHRIPTDGLQITASYVMARHPARVAAISIHVTPPAGLPDERRDALLAVAEHCTVHNSLVRPPDVLVQLGIAAAPVSS
jgi:putative redox protein